MTGRVVFDYMYRDAANYKAYGPPLLKGEVTEEDQRRLKSKLESGEFFIAEQIGIPALYGELWSLSSWRADRMRPSVAYPQLVPAACGRRVRIDQ